MGGAADYSGSGRRAVLLPCYQYPLARDKVRYVDEPVAIVVAIDRAHADEAAELAKVEYEPLPVIADCDAARTASAQLLHDTVPGNIAARWTDEIGNVARAFASADRVVGDCSGCSAIPACRWKRPACWPELTKRSKLYISLSENSGVLRFSVHRPMRHVFRVGIQPVFALVSCAVHSERKSPVFRQAPSADRGKSFRLGRVRSRSVRLCYNLERFVSSGLLRSGVAVSPAHP